MDIVIGAGVSGLSYSCFTKNSYLVIEKEQEIGGYCRTIKQDGFVWDYSGHFFHFQNPDIKAFVLENINIDELCEVKKNTQILYKDRYIDFPFQKNIHQLEKEEFIDCLYDLFVARDDEMKNSFKNMVYSNFGKGIAEKFLIPYNQKLYACDLDRLDSRAMGRFFPKASREEIILNFRDSKNISYNSSFIYPKGGAIEYVNSLVKRLDSSKISLKEEVTSIDILHKEVKTTRRTIKYDNLISTMPFPMLLDKCGIDYDPDIYTWNKVLVFNLGFDKKGDDVKNSWVYIPDPDILFYRVGYYDNILNTNKMSLYVEIGFSKDMLLSDITEYLDRTLADLRKIKIVSDQHLVSWNYVIMDPAYVHINKKSIEEVQSLKDKFAKHNVYSIGRYGSWTYCSIEDNILEAKKLAEIVK